MFVIKWLGVLFNVWICVFKWCIELINGSLKCKFGLKIWVLLVVLLCWILLNWIIMVCLFFLIVNREFDVSKIRRMNVVINKFFIMFIFFFCSCYCVN